VIRFLGVHVLGDNATWPPERRSLGRSRRPGTSDRVPFALIHAVERASAYRIALNRMLNQVHQPKSKHTYPDRSNNGGEDKHYCRPAR
jgi:hypothetical protein